MSFFLAFKSRFEADKSFKVCALDLTFNLGCSSVPKFCGFPARVGFAYGHLWFERNENVLISFSLFFVSSRSVGQV